MNIIKDTLTQYEAEYKIRILFAGLCGSRAYGFHKEHSDYDVRVVFSQPLGTYLDLWNNTETLPAKTLEIPAEMRTGSTPVEISFEGWDLGRALRLAEKSNCTLMEALWTPEVYKLSGSFAQLKYILRDSFTPRRLAHHYNGQFMQAHRDKDNLCHILYMIKSGLALEHLKKFPGEFPPVDLLACAGVLLDGDTKPEMLRILDMTRELVALRRLGRSGYSPEQEEVLKPWFEQIIEHGRTWADQLPAEPKPSREELQFVFNCAVLGT